jgi:molybdate transport system substrate-binding protein
MRLAKTIRHLLLVICLGSGVPHLSAADVTVFAAASLIESLQEIGADFEKQSGDKIIFNFGASSTLARQVQEGAPADIFFSADEPQMNRLEKEGLLVAGSRRNRLSNSLVVVVAANHGAVVRSPKDLARPDIQRVALGDPKAVPIGIYARKYLENAGLWEVVAPKVVPTENVRGALAALGSGNADASIVYKTDALISSNVVIAYSVPLEEGPDIRYPVALVQGGRNPKASKRFLAFLATGASAKVFEKRGFIVIREP